jgi:two-component system sensor histidine kinase DesK
MQTVDLATRWPLYILAASAPMVTLLIVGSQPNIAPAGAAGLLLVSVGQTIVCIALLRDGIAHMLGGPRPSGWHLGLAAALTLAGVAVSTLAFPRPATGTGEGFQLGLSAGASTLLFCAALTGALAPLLNLHRLLAAVALPAVVAGGLQITAGTSGRPVWAVNYLVCVGGAAATYRFTVWILGVVWEMDRARDVRGQLAVAQERLRIARDLHDVLGRNLALIAVNSELAAQLARRGQDGAVERMLDVHKTAHDSMREVREVVAGYRRADLASELAGARSVLRSAGIAARIIGDGSALPPTAQAVLGWVVREATTNIIRHSEATSVRIEIDIDPHPNAVRPVLLRIENDGVLRPQDDGGAGLIGLRERMLAIGGDLSAGPTSGGRFLVEARLPLAAAPRPALDTVEPVP